MGILKYTKRSLKSKATNAMKCTMYQAMWRQTPPKGYNHTAGRKKKNG